MRIFIVFTLMFAFYVDQGLALGEVVSGEFLIKLKKDSSSNVHSKIFGKANLKTEFQTEGLAHIQLKPGQSIEQFKNDPEIEYVEPNYVLSRFVDAGMGEPVSIQQARILAYNYSQSTAPIRANQGWALTTSYSSSNRPIVAVIDTGVDSTHSVFVDTGAMWVNSQEIAGNGIDDDQNGFVDDISGWNFYSGTSSYLDDEGHGTHVAGIVLGATQDILSTPREPAKIQIMALKFLSSNGSGSTSGAIAAIEYAINNGAKVVNCSWGGENPSSALSDVLKKAYSRGILIVTAAGNFAKNSDVTPLYPASFYIPSNVSVAATSGTDYLASFSNYGKSKIYVGAPGISIISSVPGNLFSPSSGTSMAAPLVAGAAALAWREAPQLTGYQIKEAIGSSSQFVPALDAYIYTGKRLNVESLIAEVASKSGLPAELPEYTEQASTSQAAAPVQSKSNAGCGMVKSIVPSGFGGGSGPPMAVVILALPFVVLAILRSRPRDYKRQYPRFGYNAELKVARPDGNFLHGQVKTFGFGGLGFSLRDTAAAVTLGDILDLQVQGPDKVFLNVKATVVWSENGHFGVQFKDVEYEKQLTLHQWVGKLSMGMSK